MHRVVAQYSRPRFRGPVTCVACETRYNRWVLGVTNSGHYFCYDTIALEPSWCCHTDGSLTCGSFTPNDYHKFVTASRDNHVRVYDTDSPESPVKTVDCGVPVHCCSFNSTAPVLAAALDGGRVRIIDIREKVNLNQLETQHDDDVWAVTWLPGSRNSLVAGDKSGRLFMFDIRSRQPPYQFAWYRSSIDDDDADDAQQAHDSAITGLIFDRPGTTLFSLDAHGFLKQWDAAKGLTHSRMRKFEIPRKQTPVGMCLCDDDVLVPARNCVARARDDTSMVGHIRDVTWLTETGEGFVSAGDDACVCIWRRNDELPPLVDESDWSD